MKRQLLTTDDGSQTFFVEKLNENYHSKFGAIEEAKTVFIQNAYHFCEQQDVSILEIGFGTGLNAFLTFLENQQTVKKVYYETIELYPIDWSELEKLTYIKKIFPEKVDFFKKIHTTVWEKSNEIDANFSLKKVNSNLLEYHFNQQFDVIYFDAFAPDIQPEMWTTEIFKKLYQHLNSQGILTTYSAKGLIKRRLKEVGFQLEYLKHPHKREMIRAIKI